MNYFNIRLSRKHKIIAGIVAFFILVIGCTSFWAVQETTTKNGEEIIIHVKPGMTAEQIADLLYQQGLLNEIVLFRLTAKIEGLDSKLQSGDYVFSRGMSFFTMIHKMATGENLYQTLTIPEGFTLNQVADLIESKGLGRAETFKNLAKSYAPYEYMKDQQKQGLVAYEAEGFLFPDTYRIPPEVNEKELLEMFVRQFNQKVSPAIRRQAQQMGISERQLIILSSLVEKEARLDEERPIIAGVFMNRLKQGMPLQSCATVQYILGTPKPILSIEDTEIPSPFNTYLHTGLPPGPIASPGLASIQAVLHPEQTDYLYFVADQTGRHHFSRTYEEHLLEIQKVES